MDKVIIIGASGHARVCLDILEAQGREVLGFYDDDPNLVGTMIHGYPILGNTSEFAMHLQEANRDIFIAIGNNIDRCNIAKLLRHNFRKNIINAIHSSAVISKRIKTGMGNFVAPGVIINTGTILENFVILNTGATIDHDNIIKNYAQISPGCNLAGNVTVEESAFIGTGAIVIPGKIIGKSAIIGAGSVVITDIPPFCTAVGVPARVIKNNLTQKSYEK